jgi:hypothetical protein
MKDSNGTIGNPTRYFPVCSAVKRKLYYIEFRMVLNKYVQKGHNGLFSWGFNVSGYAAWKSAWQPKKADTSWHRTWRSTDRPQTTDKPSVHTYRIRLLVYCAVAYRKHSQSGPWRHGLGVVAFQFCVWEPTRNPKAIKMEKTRSRFLATRQSAHNCSQLLCSWIRLHEIIYPNQLTELGRRQKRETSKVESHFSTEEIVK